MSKKSFLTLAGFAVIIAAAALFLGLGPLTGQKNKEQRQTRIIIPHETGNPRDSGSEQAAWEDSVSTKAPLNEGEMIVAVLNQDLDGDPAEEQIVAFRNMAEMDSPVYITCIDFDEHSGEYQRVWTAPTAASRPGTVSLFSQDLVGDRGTCVILTGMDNQGQHTMTVFRRDPRAEHRQPYTKIAELRIDGSISVQEAERSQAYHQGIASGKSYTIAAFGQDYRSGNMLDQIEIIYAFNPGSGLYEQQAVTGIPGSQIEQRRLRELLSGENGVFENFINDLWYYVSPQGTVDSRQYIYFDPQGREIIFYSDETQQVFTWRHSNSTRYGLYISSQNISVATLRYFVDIELESLDSIRIRVFEDVRLRIHANATWDGSYRRAGAAARAAVLGDSAIKPGMDALYDSSLGRLRFYQGGSYELSSGGTRHQGRYVFFRVNGQELLELRPESAGETRIAGLKPENANPGRLVYRVEPLRKTGAENSSFESLTLSPVRLGAGGIQELHEGMITLSPAQ
jgi:hypothetical protein